MVRMINYDATSLTGKVVGIFTNSNSQVTYKIISHNVVTCFLKRKRVDSKESLLFISVYFEAVVQEKQESFIEFRFSRIDKARSFLVYCGKKNYSCSSDLSKEGEYKIIVWF